MIANNIFQIVALEQLKKSPKELTEFLEHVTIVSTTIIVVTAVFFAIYIWRKKRQDKLAEHKRWIDQMPSFISTLGVLGTFLGITIGLLFFDTKQLDSSIPLLLEGLKTAFFTSLTGMLCSMGLSSFISRTFDSNNTGPSTLEDTVKQMAVELREMRMSLAETVDETKKMRSFYRELPELSRQTAEATTVMARLMEEKSESFDKISSRLHNIKESETRIMELLAEQNNMLTNIGGNNEGLITEVKNTNEYIRIVAHRIRLVKDAIEATDHRLGEMQDVQSSQVGIDEEINQKVGALSQKLHDEVEEIEQSMDKTNQLLKSKFEEFAELLKKSNTEALVEVMKKVTEEFQKQMNALISKLVKENFDQLNKSVERMNKWQQDNKEMIKELTTQYRDMAQQFGQTGQTLHKVGSDTKQLVSDGGKLEQLIKSLNAVLVEDKKFVEITQKLESTVELTKSNMQQFDESTSKLNEWVRKQRNFVDGVNNLIAKLEELSKLRDYSDEFWRETKKGMEAGVNIIKEGSKQLQTQITELDTTFYERLSTTLSELDTCIQAMIEGNNR